MTISSTNRKAGPFTGNDSAIDFPFSFKVFSDDDLYVVLADSSGAETVSELAVDYTVSLNIDQEGNPGGTITLTDVLETGYSLTITSALEYLQPIDITNNGGFYPKVISQALDRLTIFCQQLSEQINRSLKLAVSVPSGVNVELPAPIPYQVLGWGSGGGEIVNVDPAYATALYSDLASAAEDKGASMVGFSGESYYPPGTVGNKLQQTPSLQDFWRSGDGTDYSSALQRALDSDEPVISGLGRSYTVGGGITGRGNLTLRDIILDAPGLSSNAYVIDFSGTEGTPQVLTADHDAATWAMTVPDGASFAVDGWAFLRSNAYWAAPAADNVKYGEYVQIAGISGNTLTFYGSTLLAYTQANGATITPIIMYQDIILDNIQATGPLSTGNQGGFRFRRCGNVELRNVRTTQFDYSHLVFDQSVRCAIRGGGGNKTGDQEGLDYGVVLSNGCFDILVDGYRGDSMRHLVTIGGSQGISRLVSAINCRGTNLTDAGMDSHSACYEHTFANNFLSFSNYADTTIDGIATQGGAPIITGNQIYNCKRHGVAWMPETLSAFTGPLSGMILDNRLRRPQSGGSTSAVFVSTPASGSGYAPIASVTIARPQASGFSNSVLVQANTAPINKVIIDGVQCDGPMTSRSVFVYASGADINGVEICGGHHESSGSTSPVISLTGVGENRVRNWRVNGTHIKRDGVTGTVGLALTLTANGRELGNTFENTTSPFTVDAGSTGYRFDSDDDLTVTIKRQQVTIVEGSVTLTSVNVRDVRLDTEAASATDDLSTINGGSTLGQTITLYTTVTSRDVVVKDGVGNLRLAGDRTLSHPEDRLTLRFDGTNWFEVAFADNGA